MDANSDDSYNSPAKDENTAIERSLMNLRDIEVRCMKAARMCYASSSKYEHNGFYIRCVGAVAFGVTSSLSGPVIEHFVKPYTQSHILDSEFLLYLIGTGLAIVIFFGVVRAVEKAIGTWYDEKAPKFNEAAAKWQELELRIKAFLAAAVKDTITVQDCKLFTEECAKKRKEICLIACPDQSVYTKYQSDNKVLIERMENLREMHKKRRQKHLFSC
ncbi:uncharacterized protein LOC124271905 isoform X1 [Haliotis rubra]|uniref:uncharacterized protein LOC124271905 isoform X1 n=1 Tax=Haliotis rubra TaxID=36100 RepID=UPI001EE5B57B|nr:uncharacterized protein LOC124271905 isoform X1 [Haliotis rubra]